MEQSESTSENVVTFVGPLPPPVTGMTAMMEVIVTALRRQGSVICYDWSRHRPVQGIRWKLTRAWGFLTSCMGVLLSGRQVGRVLYFPVNSSWGLAYDMTLAAMGRMLGYRIVLHHHTYAYIDRWDWRMAVVDRLIGVHGVHAVHCEKMADDYRTQYKTQATFLIVPPTIVSSDVRRPDLLKLGAEDQQEPFVLGFLSNLTFAKGLEEVLEAFEILVGNGANVRLVLAGPCMHRDARRRIDQVTSMQAERVEYRGPVYGDEKAQFYMEIDAFIFPSRNESWGIVLTEAIAYGKPVIANERGCVSHIVNNGCGRVVSRGEDFISVATDAIETWMSDSDAYSHASRRALERTTELEREAAEQLPAFVSQLRSLN